MFNKKKYNKMENGLSYEEKKIESKIQILQENIQKEDIVLQYKKMPYENISEYQIILYFPSENDENNETKENIKVLLLINLTKKKIYIYSLNINQISDARDLFHFISQKNIMKFNYESINLLDIIENIKNFVSNISKKDLSKIGSFYLGEEYDINAIFMIKDLFRINCFHFDVIRGEYLNIPSLVCISDDYFCLYEYGNNYNKKIKDIKNKFTLVFYANLKSIISFKKSLVDSIVTIEFRRNVNNKVFCLKISSDEEEDMDKVMNILIEKIKNIRYRMNIYEKKQGKLPQIDIVDTEQNISLYEDKLQKEENVNDLKQLLKLYEDAIVFYSAINDNKYIEYNNKVRKLLKNEKYSHLLS
jgi:hypothetical protein